MKSSIFVFFKKFLTCLTFVTMILLSNFVSASPANYNAQHIVIMEVNSAISPGAITYLESGFARLNKLDRPLAIIKLDTPGGLLSITHKIMKLITTAKAPVVIWITPEGALAGSAGAIISSSAHFLYMTPGTSIGAATPIIAHSGEDIQTDSKKKIVNSLVSQVKSLSKLRNRKSSGFEEMITKAKSFTAKESLKAGFIDGVTQNLEEVIAALNGKKFSLQGKEFTLQVNSSVKQINFNKGLGQKLIDILTHPSVSYFFLILGLLLLYWELLTPGGVVAGSIGSIFVLLAAISMYMIPINWGGLALIILATFLFVLELFITSYGILTIGGLTSLIVGSLYLYRTEEAYI
ncbi:MAG: ATP-dependent Clp protease proteolytic subunit, partial [Candidatus Brocadiales bacterium]|nr:ATP-dependent Clp protease proteolytic subunit [Candidatus Brocadiales bacterium]